MDRTSAAGESSDLRQAKQGFPRRLEGFSGELSRIARNICLKWLCPDSQYANDAAVAQLRELGRLFSHPKQGDSKRFAPEISESRARFEDRDAIRKRHRPFH